MPGEAEVGGMDRRRYLALFLTVLVVALVVRVWHLAGKSLWLDEIMSLIFARLSLVEIMTNTEEFNPPLYYALLHFWIKVFGSTEAALRSLSVILGFLAVALTGWVGRVIGGRRLSLLAMTMAALSPMLVELSQWTRTYSLYLFFSMASFGCLLMWVRKGRAGTRWAVGYVLSTALMSYGHNYWVFNIVAQQGYAWWQIFRGRIPWRRWLLMSGGVLLLAAPWMLVLIAQAAKLQREGFWIETAGPGKLVTTVSGFLIRGKRWSMPAGLSLLVMASVGLAAGLRRNGDKAAGGEEYGPDPGGDSLLLALWLLCPLVIPWVISLAATPIFHAKYTVAAAPALFMLVSRGLLSLPGRFLRWMLILVLILTAGASLKRSYSWQMEDWRSAAAAIGERSRPDDHLLVGPFYVIPVLEYYYRGPLEAVPLELDLLQQRSESLERLTREGAVKGRRVWVVFRGGPAAAASLLRKLEGDHPDLRLAGKRRFGDLVNAALFLPRE